MDLELNANIGCFFIGVIIATPLYGLTCAQVMYYVRDYPEDWIWLKSLVAVLFLLDTATSIVSFEFVWHNLVAGHSNPLVLTSLDSTGAIEYLLAAFIVIIVQSYYMRTIWILLANKPYKIPLMAVLVALTLVSFGFGVANCVTGIRSPAIPALYTKLRVGASIQPFTASVSDVFITVMLCWVLHNENTGLAHTDSLLRTLMIYAINRGILTTALQVGQAVSFVASSPDAFYWSLFHFPGSKVYVNSALAILNARHHIRGPTGNYNPSTTISANATMGRNIPSRSVDEEVASTSYSSRDGGRLRYENISKTTD